MSVLLRTESDLLLTGLKASVAAAQPFVGGTAPNPPVGSAWVERNAESSPVVHAVGAHRRVGAAHAERSVLEQLSGEDSAIDLETGWLVVTLEPCAHKGRQPPCVEVILKRGIKNVAYAFADPNPLAGGGADRLRASGLRVVDLSSFASESPAWREALDQARHQLQPFLMRFWEHRPWVVVKTAHRELDDGSWTMLPPADEKTFTSQEALTQAHRLRKESDAIVTGSGTILADLPQFTVRNVSDHADKRRILYVMDRRQRVAPQGAWLEERRLENIDVLVTATGFAEVIEQSYRAGCLQILVEAGPLVSRLALTETWDEQWAFLKRRDGSTETLVKRRSEGDQPCLLGL